MSWIIRRQYGLADFISLNGDKEYITNESGQIKKWESMDAALIFCERNGLPEESIEVEIGGHGTGYQKKAGISQATANILPMSWRSN